MKLVATLLILAAIVAVSYGENYSDGGSNHPINAKLGRSYMNYMDKTANPCSDFYQYSCGNWSHYHNYDSYDSTQLNSEVNMEFIEFMENTHMDDKPDFVKNAYEFYASCRGQTEFNVLPAMKLLEEHENMKWILRMETVDKNAKFDWAHTLGLMRKYGMNEIFVKETAFVDIQETDSSKVIVELSKPSGEYFFNYLSAYDMAQFNNTVEMAEVVKHIADFYNEIKEFEGLLAKLFEIEEEMAKQVMKVKVLPFYWLSKYLAAVLDIESLDSNMEITISDMPYMKALDNILKKYDEEFLQRYLEVKFLEHINDNNIVNNELECIQSLRGLMPLAMHWIYEQMHPELEQEIPKIHQMFDNILKFVKKTLRSDKSGVVNKTFLTKLDNMQLKIGNLPRQDTIKALDAFYPNLSLTHTDYFGNYLQLKRLSFNNEQFLTTNDVVNKFNEYFDNNENENLKDDILPRYEPVVNVLIVPSYLLRQPIYHWAYGDLFKQSSLGSIMAHYVYSALPKEFFSEGDMEKIVGMGGIHTAYEMFFSTLVPEQMSEYQSIVDMIEVPLKQLFFINAAQYYCVWRWDKDRVNLVMSALPEFVEAFDCKNIQFRRIFKK